LLDLTHVRSFIALAEELHFGQAARRLNMTQPPLSRQIRLLEEELGVRLFDRNSHAVALAAAGRAFLPEARALLAASEAAAAAARRAARTRSGGSVTLGFIGASTYAYLPRLVARARAELPDTELLLKEMSGAAQVEALTLGRIDLGLVRPLGGASPLMASCVMREELALAIPLGHRLAGRRRAPLRELEGEPFITYSAEGPYMRALLSNAFQAAGVRPKVVQAVSQAQTILSLVSAGLGLAIVPGEVRAASFDNVAFRAIDAFPAPSAELHAIWRPEDRNPVLAPLRELSHQVMAPRS